MYNKIESFEITSSNDFPKHKNENEEGAGWDYSCIRTYWPARDFYKLNSDFTFKLNVATKSVENQLVYCRAVT